jgi:hypothetical protein
MYAMFLDKSAPLIPNRTQTKKTRAKPRQTGKNRAKPGKNRAKPNQTGTGRFEPVFVLK